MTRAALILLSLAAAVAFAAPAQGALTVSLSNGTVIVAGTNKAERVALRLKSGAPGTLQIDLGANGSTDRSFKRTRFSKIVVNTGGGADAITLDESRGAFWNTEQTKVNGGSGTDSLAFRGTAGADAWDVTPNAGHVKVARGTPFVDSGTVERIALQGLGGADVIHAVAGLAGLATFTFTGGAGLDDLLGSDGADTFLWKRGDGNDVVNGDAGTDRVRVDGSNGGDAFVVSANGARVAVAESDSGSLLDVGTVETVEVNALGGADTFGTSGNLAALTALDVDGGDGSDVLNGGNGADLLRGGAGDDSVDGNQGNDTSFLGGGSDTFRWDPGDGSDTFEGEGGADVLDFFASNAGETIDLMANGKRLRLLRNIGAITMDGAGTERVRLHTFGGADTVGVHDLATTAVTRVDLKLEGALDSAIGDGAADAVTVEGTAGKDAATITTAAGQVNVAGLPVLVAIGQAEGPADTLAVLGLGGADTLTAGLGLRVHLDLTLDGAAGADRLTGGDGDDTLLGGTENDTIFGGPGNDTIDSGLGADTMNGGPGADTYTCTTPGDVITSDGADAAAPVCP
jgi:Ca2+-binding RTX toxin-like protein